MKIEFKETRQPRTTFRGLKPGDCFYHKGFVYMKLGGRQREGARLHDGTVCEFIDDCEVGEVSLATTWSHK